MEAINQFEFPAGSSVFGETDLPKTLPFPIVEKTALNHDSYLFKFGLPEGKTLGLPVGGCIKFFAQINGEEVSRSYTPITDVRDTNTVDIVIKIYRPTAEFPEGGKMTRHLESLNVGDTVDIKGPLGRIRYSGHGRFDIKQNP